MSKDIGAMSALWLGRALNGFEVAAQCQGNEIKWVATTHEQLMALVAEWAGADQPKRVLDPADSAPHYNPGLKP